MGWLWWCGWSSFIIITTTQPDWCLEMEFNNAINLHSTRTASGKLCRGQHWTGIFKANTFLSLLLWAYYITPSFKYVTFIWATELLKVTWHSTLDEHWEMLTFLTTSKCTFLYLDNRRKFGWWQEMRHFPALNQNRYQMHM